MRPSVLPLEEVLKQKPAWKELFELRSAPSSRPFLEALHVGAQEEIRRRAAMMASVDEGVGSILNALEQTGQLDHTCIVFLGDNGYFFGEHGLGAERRFPYEEGIRTAFFVRYPERIRPGAAVKEMILALDIAPTLIELAGGRPGPHIQGRSLVPLMNGRPGEWRAISGGVLQRVGLAVDRGHELQGSANPAPQAGALGPQGRGRRAL
jgi:arylsulfatase A-like enzyme